MSWLKSQASNVWLQYTKALLRLRYLLLLFGFTIFFFLYEDTFTTSSFQ